MMKHLCAWIRMTAELREGPTPSDPVEGHPSMETYPRITFIVLVEAGSHRAYVDVSSALLTSQYVLALKRHLYKSHD